jgi:hypothetical protein
MHHDQRAVDAMVDIAVVGDRIRPVLRHFADADRDAADADGVYSRQSQVGSAEPSGAEEAASPDQPTQAVPEIAYPKAAE